MTNQEEKELTPQEQEILKQKMMAEWKEVIPFLEAKKQYEGLITELHELEMRRTYALMKLAEMTAPPPKEAPRTLGNDTAPSMRALKKEPVQ